MTSQAVLQDDAIELLGVLEHVSRRLDRLFRSGRTTLDADRLMSLSEASHSLHRALVALRRDV